MVSSWQRQSDGTLKENPRTLPGPPKSFNGGGGLISTAGDYVRFMQMILRRGGAGGKERILQSKKADMMAANQTGDLQAGILKSMNIDPALDLDFHPGFSDRLCLGFPIYM